MRKKMVMVTAKPVCFKAWQYSLKNGVIATVSTKSGVVFVHDGCWLLEDDDGSCFVVSNKTFQKKYQVEEKHGRK